MYAEVAKQQRLAVGAVVGVLLAERVRVDPEPLNVLGPDAIACRDETFGPECATAERDLEVADRPHRDGVDHLLVELRIAFGGGEAVLSQQVAILEVDGRIGCVARGIDVDHLEVFADRAGV